MSMMRARRKAAPAPVRRATMILVPPSLEEERFLLGFVDVEDDDRTKSPLLPLVPLSVSDMAIFYWRFERGADIRSSAAIAMEQ